MLGDGLLAGIVPDLADLQVRTEEPASPLDLALPGPTGWRAADPAALAELSYRVVVAGHLEPLALPLGGEVAEGLLWGNAASAMAGALGVLVRARPGLRDRATALAAALLAHGRLADTGQLGVTGEGLGFRRRSCCLYYRLPGGALCGDCGPGLAMIQTRPCPRHAFQIVGVSWHRAILNCSGGLMPVF